MDEIRPSRIRTFLAPLLCRIGLHTWVGWFVECDEWPPYTEFSIRFCDFCNKEEIVEQG